MPVVAIGDADVAVVEIDDPSHDGETQTGPGAAPGGVDAVESVEDQVALLDRDARTAVLDLESDVVTLEPSTQRDRRVRRRRLAGVVDQVDQQLVQAVGVTGQAQRSGLDRDGQFLVGSGEMKLPFDVAEQVGDRHRGALERIGPTLQPGQIQQLRHHAAQAFGLPQHLAQ